MPFLTTQHDMARVKTNDANSHQRMGQGYPAEVWSSQILGDQTRFLLWIIETRTSTHRHSLTMEDIPIRICHSTSPESIGGPSEAGPSSARSAHGPHKQNLQQSLESQRLWDVKFHATQSQKEKEREGETGKRLVRLLPTVVLFKGYKYPLLDSTRYSCISQ